MPLRYPAALALTLAVLPAPGTAAQRPEPHLRRAPAARDVYSVRELRRAKIILELKLLELRAERLERVRRAIEKRIPVNDLLKE